jgi:hypothetical protein
VNLHDGLGRSGSSASIPAIRTTSQWAHLADVAGAEMAWAHSGLVVTAAGEVIGFHAGQLVAFGRDGQVVRTARPGLTEGHGITLVEEDGTEYLWISDPGFVFTYTVEDGDEAFAGLFGKGISRQAREPRVVKLSLDGQIRAELPIPAVDPIYAPAMMMGPYCPCGTAVDQERFGGTGDVWVADGYGSSLVYCFDKSGNIKATLTGEEGGGRFVCPHAVFIDRRGGKTPELYIADRENKRLQVYGLDGAYRRTVGADFLNSPSGFAQWGDLLVVAELYSRLAVLDEQDNLVGYVGAEPGSEERRDWPERPGWPNGLTDDGRATLPPLPEHGCLNSPHSVAVDADGNLYVSEWLLGARYTKFEVTPRSTSR